MLSFSDNTPFIITDTKFSAKESFPKHDKVFSWCSDVVCRIHVLWMGSAWSIPCKGE